MEQEDVCFRSQRWRTGKLTMDNIYSEASCGSLKAISSSFLPHFFPPRPSMFCVVFNGPVNWLIIFSPLALQPQASKILRKGEEKCLPQLSFLVDPLFFLLMTVVFLLVFLPDSIWFWRFFKEFLTNCLLQAKIIPSLLVAFCTKRSENF